MTILKWGLIGAGDIARKRVAPALRDLPNCDFLAVSRARPELAESFAKEFGAQKWYGNWRDLLGDKEVDVVYVATPVHLHAAQTIAAAEAGKHVLCEKPMALNVRECAQMIAACRANNVKLGIAYYRHFHPVIARVKSILAAAELGDVVFAQINAFEWFNPQPDHARYWLLKRDQGGGGPMFDFGCHRLEVLLNLFGPARHIAGLIANVAFEREVEDTAAALLQFERGGYASLTVTHAAAESQDTLDIFGTKGSVHIPVLNQGEMIIKIGDEQRVESHPAAANMHQPLIEDFVEAAVKNREPKVNGEVGRSVAKLEGEIYRSAQRS
jgi:predicted dehydrogenase